jgi:diguanylate cyclase (GGDEF)-like protein
MVEETRIPISVPLTGVTTVAVETTVGPTSGDALALIWPDATAVAVYWNGDLLRRFGNPEQPTANLWSGLFHVPLPDSTADTNRLRLELTSPYMVQLLRPPIVADAETVRARASFHNLLYGELLLLCMGASIMVGIMLILLARLQRSRIAPGILLGAAAILAAVYAFDYTTRFTSGTLIEYRWLRVLLISSGYAAALLFTMGLERYFHERFRISWFVAVPTGAAVVVLAASPSLAWLFRWLPIINAVIFVDLIVVLSLMVPQLRRYTFLLIPFAILALSLGELLLVMVLDLPWPPVLQFTVLITAMLLSVQIIGEYTEVYRDREALQAAYNRDALTGSYNRRALDQFNLADFDAAVVTDLDNFKAYNDTYGHAAGDAMLKLFARTLTDNTRSDDVVVRYGGDEFIVLLRKAEADDATHIMRRVRKRFRRELSEGDLDVSFGVERVAAQHGATFQQADGAMYAMKAKHKAPR